MRWCVVKFEMHAWCHNYCIRLTSERKDCSLPTCSYSTSLAENSLWLCFKLVKHAILHWAYCICVCICVGCAHTDWASLCVGVMCNGWHFSTFNQRQLYSLFCICWHRHFSRPVVSMRILYMSLVALTSYPIVCLRLLPNLWPGM